MDITWNPFSMLLGVLTLEKLILSVLAGFQMFEGVAELGRDVKFSLSSGVVLMYCVSLADTQFGILLRLSFSLNSLDFSSRSC